MRQFRLTRYAPTPSGFLHIGNVYSFILTAALAQKHQSRILLRIDDMDRDRVKKKYIQDIFDTLDFLELPYHLGPKDVDDFEKNYSQRKRLTVYRDSLEEIKKSKTLFACDCSRRKILNMGPKGYYTGFCQNRKLPFESPEVCWRVKAPLHHDVKFNSLTDGMLTGKIPGILSDFVVYKKDKFPSYQLCSVIDDIHYGVDLVIRGKDLWGSSLAQVYLSRFLPSNQFADATFHHHPLLTGPDKEKLSKSAGATSIQFLRKSGKKPAEVYQMVADLVGLKDPVKDLEGFKNQLI